jgi:hypothetical protein
MRSMVWLALCITSGVCAYLFWYSFVANSLGLGPHPDPVRQAKRETVATYWLVGTCGFAAATLATFIGFLASLWRIWKGK